MAITGYLVSIPVFSDAACVILTPLVKAIHRKTKIPLAVLAVSLSAGLLATHVYVPPTPGFPGSRSGAGSAGGSAGSFHPRVFEKTSLSIFAMQYPMQGSCFA